MASYSFPSADNTVPRFSEWQSGPQQRIYERPLWDAIPLPLFAFGVDSDGLINDGGVLVVASGQGWPTSGLGLPIGGLFTNGADGGPASVVMPTSPPLSSPLYYGLISARELLTVGGANIRTAPPPAGSRIIWNSGGELWVA